MTMSFQLAINNEQCSMNEQLAISNVAAFHCPSLLAHVSPIANRTLSMNSEGVMYV